MSYTFGFSYPLLPKTVNAWRGLHWRFRYAEDKKWKKLVGELLLVHRKPPAPLKRAKLTLTRFSSNCPDHDGLVSSFKTILDALVKNGVLEDDSFKHIGMPEYRWEKAPFFVFMSGCLAGHFWPMSLKTEAVCLKCGADVAK